MNNTFSELYKTLSTADLLEIMNKSEEYQPLAVEAAKYELDSRKLTEEELAIAKKELEARQHEEEKRKQKLMDIKTRIKSYSTSILQTISPFQHQIPSDEKSIRLISILIGGIFIYQFIMKYGLLKFMFTGSMAEWDISMILYFLPLVYIPLTGVLFWLKKKQGWILAELFFSYSALAAAPSFIYQLHFNRTVLPEFEAIFPEISLIAYFGAFIVYGGLTWVLCRKSIRARYHIDTWTMIGTLSIATILVILMVLLIN